MKLSFTEPILFVSVNFQVLLPECIVKLYAETLGVSTEEANWRISETRACDEEEQSTA